jgi:putative Mg2+ transporter-C (MgtC) family protein
MAENALDALTLEQLGLALGLILAAILGFFIGLERKFRDKEAGIRTHTIVSFGAALMMIISKFAFDAEADSARVAAQIVAGIGFLGAGIIVYRKNVVHGLTTAAGVWATSGIGLAMGAGMYIVSIFTTLLILIIQIALHNNKRFLSHLNKESFTFLVNDSDMAFKYIEEICVDSFIYYDMVSMVKKDDKIQIEVIASVNDEFSSSDFIKAIYENENIISVEIEGA